MIRKLSIFLPRHWDMRTPFFVLFCQLLSRELVMPHSAAPAFFVWVSQYTKVQCSFLPFWQLVLLAHREPKISRFGRVVPLWCLGLMEVTKHSHHALDFHPGLGVPATLLGWELPARMGSPFKPSFLFFFFFLGTTAGLAP